MIELTEIRDGLFEIFGASDVDELKDKIMTAVIDHDTDKYQQYKQLVDDDLGRDYLQMIWQYYCADREHLKQEYTPKCIGKLLAKLTHGSNEIVDLCAGSGALAMPRRPC